MTHAYSNPRGPELLDAKALELELERPRSTAKAIMRRLRSSSRTVCARSS